MQIHSTAIIDAGAVLGADCTIGPFSIIEGGVTLGKGCQIASHVVVRRGTHLGDNARVDSFTVLGGEPQSIGFDSSVESGVRIGENAIFRESCTVHRSMYAGKETIVGDDCYFMAQSHAAHDCVLGNGIILANSVHLGGHVEVGDKCFLGGLSGVHQNARIGAYSIVGSCAFITLDVPPCLMVTERNVVNGLNRVGLKRLGFDAETLKDLKACYRMVYSGALNLKVLAAEAKANPELGTGLLGTQFLDFFEAGKRGFARPKND